MKIAVKKSDLIRIGLLTVLQTCMIGFGYFLLLVIYWDPFWENRPVLANCVFIGLLCVPILVSFLLVKESKIWLVSLAFQLILGVAIQYFRLYIPFRSFVGRLCYALILLSLQIIGGGAKLLILKLKAKKKNKVESSL